MHTARRHLPHRHRWIDPRSHGAPHDPDSRQYLRPRLPPAHSAHFMRPVERPRSLLSCGHPDSKSAAPTNLDDRTARRASGRQTLSSLRGRSMKTGCPLHPDDYYCMGRGQNRRHAVPRTVAVPAIPGHPLHGPEAPPKPRRSLLHYGTPRHHRRPADPLHAGSCGHHLHGL